MVTCLGEMECDIDKLENRLVMKRSIFLVSILLSCLTAAGQNIDTDYSNQKKRAIKIEFFSPLVSHTTIGYEKYVKDWFSWEAKVGVIGLGIDPEDINPGGILFRGGPKFKLNPDFITRDLRGSHLLSGKYIRPEIAMSFYSEDEVIDGAFGDTIERKSYSSLAILITYGRQYVLADIMTVDYHIGLGYGFDNTSEGRYNYSHSNGDNDFPVAVTAGFTIGVLLR